MNETLKLLFALLVLTSINVKVISSLTSTTYTPLLLYKIPNRYGNTFGPKSLKDNTYIAKNYFFEEHPPLGPGPLAKALFSSGSEWTSFGPYDTLNNKRWNQYEDRRWRETTRAPYFENKIPGEDKVIPASAVAGAATAFGLVSLLPLAVPRHKPLMYCGNTNLKQLAIRINDKNVYFCNNNDFEIVCPDNFRNQMSYQCMNKKITCDLKYDEIQGNIYCRNETLFSKTNIFCTSTTNVAGRIYSLSILECTEGEIPEKFSSFIPTTTPSPYISTTTTTAKPLSFAAKAHLFMLKLMGRFDVVEDEIAEMHSIGGIPWYPEPITNTPDTDYLSNRSIISTKPTETSIRVTTTSPITTTMVSYQWMRVVSYPNNITRIEPLPEQLIEIAENAPPSEISSKWMKVLISNRS